MTHSPHIHDTVRSPLTSHLGQSRPQMATTRHVVVGFGTGDISKNALAFAVTFAAGQDADVHVVHCVDSEDMPIETDSPQYENRFQHAVAAQRDHAVPWQHYRPSPEPGLTTVCEPTRQNIYSNRQKSTVHSSSSSAHHVREPYRRWEPCFTPPSRADSLVRINTRYS